MANFASHFFSLWDKPTAEATEEHLQKLLMEEEKPSPMPVGLAARVTQNSAGRIFYLNEETETRITIFYIHGGGYEHDFSPFHWHYIKKLTEQTGAQVIAPAYRLIPWGKCSDAFDLIIPLYREYSENHPEQKLVLMGDSAGGGLALGLALQIIDLGLRQPDEIIALSPWVDVTLTNPDIPEYQANDPWLTVPWLSVCGQYWAKELDPRNPKVSPIFGEPDKLRNVLLTVGTNEIFYPDVTGFFKMLDPDRNNELIIGKDMLHVFPLMPIPEAKPAEEKIIARILRGIPEKE